jgi:hypothetical protein
MSLSWQDRLHAAASEAEVVAVTREFIAQFSPSEIAELPEACRPWRFVDGSDVTDYAFDLVRHRCEEGQGAEFTMQRLTAFFSSANARLSQLLHRQPEGEPEDGDRQSA